MSWRIKLVSQHLQETRLDSFYYFGTVFLIAFNDSLLDSDMVRFAEFGGDEERGDGDEPEGGQLRVPLPPQEAVEE